MLTTLLVAGCATSKVEHPPPVEVPEAFSDAGEAERMDRWWRSMGDEGLNTFMDTALAGNLDLKTAWERLRAARAAARVSGAALYPEVDAVAEASREGGMGGGGDFEGSDGETVLSAGLTAAYEVDLWGRLGDLAEAERLRAEASYLDVQTAALTLSAEIALAWVQLQASEERLDLLERQIEVNERQVEVLENRFATGQIQRVDVLRQRQLLLETRRDLHAAESARQRLRHRLAVLSGQSPRAVSANPGGALPEPPAPPAAGLPADLVQRRPDVRAAWLRLRAANRDTAAAVSARFPRLSLSAGLLTRDQGAEELFRDWAWSFAANLAAPLIDGGRLEAEADRRRALENQRLYEYGLAVLEAFREVEDALTREEEFRRVLEDLAAQAELAEQTLEQLRLSFRNGGADFLDVLTARTGLQELERDRIAARRDRLEARIALHRALAGSFEWKGEDHE